MKNLSEFKLGGARKKKVNENRSECEKREKNSMIKIKIVDFINTARSKRPGALVMKFIRDQIFKVFIIRINCI